MEEARTESRSDAPSTMFMICLEGSGFSICFSYFYYLEEGGSVFQVSGLKASGEAAGMERRKDTSRIFVVCMAPNGERR